MENLATLTASDLGDDLRVVAFRGTERLCRPYHFDIHFQVQGADALDLRAGVGSRATLELNPEQEGAFRFHGVLASVQLLIQTPEWALYRATLVPALWHLGQDKHSNAFTKITLPDLIEKVLQDSGVLTSDDYQLQLQGSYPEEELIVQYKESNLAFLQRWMEREGLYYFFDHTGDREKLVICDHHSFHAKLAEKTIRYFPLDGGDVSRGDSFDTFASMHNATVKQVRLADYDYGRPALDVSSNTDVSDRGVGEISLYGGRFFDPAEAQRHATLRAEELRAREVVHYASGLAFHVSAGFLVELEEHPSEALNTSYLATEVHHFCNQLGSDQSRAVQRWIKVEHDDVYRVEAHLIDAQLQYRPPLETHAPRVWGYENGVVDGEADSPYAQIDADGRYKVKFHFDESDLSGGKASTFVRMAQPHGGGTEGFHFPLRKGTEVIFSFLGGDPDRPVITGVVPNATTPSPVTEANHTKNILRTGSGSHMTIDDAAGKEYIHFCTPKLTELFLGGPTQEHPDEHTNESFIFPPEEKSDGVMATSETLTYYLNTDGNAGTWVGGDYILNAMSDSYIYRNGKVLEQWLGPHVLNVEGTSKQWFQDIRETTVHGHEYLTVENEMKVDVTNDLTITVSSGKTKMDTSGTTEFKSGGKIHVHNSSGDIKIDSENGKIDIDGKTGVDIHSPVKITVESTGSDVDVKSANKLTNFSLGNWFKFTASAGIGVTLAATAEVKVGLFAEALVGGKVEAVLAYKAAISMAASIEAKFGFALNINGSAEMNMQTAKFKVLGGPEISTLPFGLQQAAAHLEQKGVKIIT